MEGRERGREGVGRLVAGECKFGGDEVLLFLKKEKLSFKFVALKDCETHFFLFFYVYFLCLIDMIFSRYKHELRCLSEFFK